MSAIVESAVVSIQVADFANLDAVGKLNLLGGGVAGIGFDPGQGLTARFSLVVQVEVPSNLLPAECSIEVFLTSGAEVVMAPGPVEPQAVRVSQNVTIDKALAFTGPARDHVPGRNVSVLDFNNGLPLAPGGHYEWHVRIDGDDSRVWSYQFVVAGPPAAPVFG